MGQATNRGEAGSQGPGATVRTIRQRRGLTLDQLAGLTELSKGHLSRFERDEKSLSVAALMRLAQALGTSVSVLLGESLDQEAIRLVRVEDRRTSVVPVDEGDYRFALLSRSGQPGVEVFTIELTAGAGIDGTSSHGGQEGLFVVSGDVDVGVADRTFALHAGDYLEFPGHLKHSTQSRSPRATILVIVDRP